MMSLKNKFFSIAGVALATATLSTFTVAQDAAPTAKGDKAAKQERREGKRLHRGGFGGKRAFGRGDHGFRGLKGLDLTDAQKEQIKTIVKANKPDGSNRDQIRAFAAARRAGTLTDAQKADMKRLREAGQAKRLTTHQLILAVLTPEQRAKFEQHKAKAKEVREDFREKRQDRRREFRKNNRPDKAKAVKSDTI